jgi:hypothetical protein
MVVRHLGQTALRFKMLLLPVSGGKELPEDVWLYIDQDLNCGSMN